MMVKRRWRWLSASLAIWLASLACTTVTQFNPLAAPTPTAAPVSAAPAAGLELQLATLAAVDQAVRDQYLRADLAGAAWEAALAQARAQAAAGLDEAAFAAVMRELAAALPAGAASYISRAERIAAETTDTTTYQGIGVYYGFRETPEPRVVILAVMAGSPAEQAGLQAHDAIYAIDGRPVDAAERDTVADRIRGPAGSQVTLSVQTAGQPRREVTVQRGTIAAGDQLRGGLAPETGIAYYRAPVAAGQELAQLIAADLQTAGADGVRGLILDLRVSGSSTGWPLLEMLTLFGDGLLGEFYSRAQTEPLSVTGAEVAGSQTAPLMILVGPDTRGAAEIFAGALQGAGRATLVGLPTPGETTGFSSVDLPDGSVFSLVTSAFRLPDGADLAQGGLTPDLRVDADWDSFTGVDDDPVLTTALAALSRP